jgi:hypothetical protein
MSAGGQRAPARPVLEGSSQSGCSHHGRRGRFTYVGGCLIAQGGPLRLVTYRYDCCAECGYWTWGGGG